MKIIRFLIFPMTFLFLHSTAAYAGDNFKIGVVDFQQVLQKSKSGQEIQDQIKQKGEALKSEIQKKQDDIKIMQEKYKRESLVLSDEQKVQKERELRDAINAYRMLQNQNNQKFNKLRSELINGAQKTIVGLAEKMGKSQGYQLIIEKQSGTVLYAEDALEITDQFVEQFDKQDTAKKN